MRFCEVMEFFDYKVVNIMNTLHVARETVNTWKKTDKIPFTKQCEIEVISKGKLKAYKES